MSDTSQTQDPQMPDENTSADASTTPPSRMTPETGMTAEAPAPVEPLSLTDKFIGILTEPAPTYENVRTTGSRTSDWLVPILLLMIVIAGATLARFSNPEFSAQIMQQQTQALHKAVDAGDMTQEQADQAERQIRSMSGFFGIFGAIAGAIGYFILFFIIALFYWLIVRFLLRGDATYTLVLSAVGLASFISILDQLVSLLLTYLTGKAFANLSPVLFMDVDIINAGFGSKILMLLNPITIWATWVTGIGLEKVGRISRVKGMIAAFSLWIIFTLLTLSMGSMGMG